jgi:hypothetical protein
MFNQKLKEGWDQIRAADERHSIRSRNSVTGPMASVTTTTPMILTMTRAGMHRVTGNS